MMPVPVFDVIFTLSPEQNVVADPAVNTGVLGIGLTMIETEVLPVAQPDPCAYTE